MDFIFNNTQWTSFGVVMGFSGIQWISGAMGMLVAALLFVGSKKKIRLIYCSGIGGLIYTLALSAKSKFYVLTHEGAMAGALVGALSLVAIWGLIRLMASLQGEPSLDDMMVKRFGGMGMDEEAMRKAQRQVRRDPIVLGILFIQLIIGAFGGLIGGVIGSYMTKLSGMQKPEVALDTVASLPEHVVPALITMGIAFVVNLVISGFMIYLISDSKGGGGCFVSLFGTVLIIPIIVLSIVIFVACGTASSNLGDHALATQIQYFCGVVSIITGVMGFWVLVGMMATK